MLTESMVLYRRHRVLHEEQALHACVRSLAASAAYTLYLYTYLYTYLYMYIAFISHWSVHMYT